MSDRISSPGPAPLICFDLGGVLLRICRTWEEACREAGLDVRDRAEDGPTLYDANDIVIRYQTGAMSCDAFYRAISESIGGVYDPGEVERIHRAWVIEEYPGAREIVHDLASSGVPTACLSNTNAAHWGRMPEFPSVMNLGVRLASHELGLHKPDPAIYGEAASRLERPPHEILFFDDLPQNVEAARRAGWAAECVDPENDPVGQMRQNLEAQGVLERG